MDAATLEHYRGLARRAYGGRRWVFGADILAGMTPVVAQLADLGVDRVLCIAASRGTGPAPDEAVAPDPIVLGLEADTVVDLLRATGDALADLPPEVVARVDAFDEGGGCGVLGGFWGDGRPVAGRPVYGARRAEWQALEDKTTVDALWDALGVRRAASEVVLADANALLRATGRIDEGSGSVWTGDSSEGFNGGAEYVRWVRDAASATDAARFFAAHCDRVRVMPFLDGLPCSIHGMVFDDAEIAFRPCEMLVFRRPGTAHFGYHGTSTYWDPRPDDREAMRALARRVGAALRERVGYRGIFTIDGVMAAGGFRPTELNPRFGGAIGVMTKRLPELPLMLLDYALREGEPFDWRPAELERLLVDAADTHRAGHAMAVVRRPVEQERETALIIEGDTIREARPGEAADFDVIAGPGAWGGFLRITPVPERTPIGDSPAARLAAAMAFVDDLWDLVIGPVEPALDVRRLE